MQITYFYNDKSPSNDLDRKTKPHIIKKNTKVIVDINILLNRVKIEQKNETKRKIILFSIVTLTIILIGTFIESIN